MEHKKIAEQLLAKITDIETDQDSVTDYLIELGHKNTFIETVICLLGLVKERKLYSITPLLSECINRAYNPGLRAHIIDDFIRHRINLESKINELKNVHKIYPLEQKLFMYYQAEKMLKTNCTALTTHLILQIAEFRGDAV